MRRRLGQDEAHLWARVTATVRPFSGRSVRPPVEASPEPPALSVDAAPAQRLKPPPTFPGKPAKPAPPPAISTPAPPPTTRATPPPDPIEPRRKRRIVREQELGPTLDLHGLDQDRARTALSGFLRRASEDGWRAVLVVTGKGSRGDGILRRMTPEWLADPALRDIVAGVSEAHRTHGGGGALYVALKRRSRA